MIKKAVIILFVFNCFGCSANSTFDKSYVSTGITERTNYTLREDSVHTNERDIPSGISLSDGLTQDEAAAIALWNNAQFQADLAALGFARADLIEASLIPNPVFSILFPAGPKQLESSLLLPIYTLWQRPHRTAMAKLDAERVAENLIQHGLGLIRDVETAYIDLLLAQEERFLAKEDFTVRSEIAQISYARLAAGDISELEAATTRVDSLRARDTVIRFLHQADES